MNDFYSRLKTSRVWLHFKDGKKFIGWSNQKIPKNGVWGEAAFTTGMSGYQETITDPSFLGQHIIFTTAHVGNYEADIKALQSEKCHGSAIIARNFSYNTFLEQINVPLISGVDTRSLVKYLTSSKESAGEHKCLITDSEVSPDSGQFARELNCNRLDLVSQSTPQTINPGENPIVLINYGCKNAIVEKLANLGFPLVTMPYGVSAKEVAALKPRLIFLSNGPGDPRLMTNEVQTVKDLMELDIPMRAICLGHQLIGLALGAKIIRLPFGQRGANHPCLDHQESNVIVTSQNHGYSIDDESFTPLCKDNIWGRELFVRYRSLFDLSIEGISSSDSFLKTVQFHPEANPGPTDADYFFSEIKSFLNSKAMPKNTPTPKLCPMIDVTKEIKRKISYKKVLVIGSGPIKIGQASEFDYSGTQACKSLKSIGIEVVLLNSNPCTIMTDPNMAFRTYIEPITEETVKKIIIKEKVDSVLSTMGGQTALNICLHLEQSGFLKECNVALLGAGGDTIYKTEDREAFSQELAQLGFKTGNRTKVASKEEALKVAGNTVHFPLIIRRDFALGGKGAALVHNIEDLKNIIAWADVKFPISLEKSLLGWKEIELEVMVDSEQNGVVVCSIENIDPCGIHTGDSITVAPAQTISDRCYQQLRTIALTVAKHMGVTAGGANVQFAINPQDENDIVVIEMNPRVSRSSALASKATGCPIAKVSALLAVGLTLREIVNDITKNSPAAFEPTLDYVAVKIPIFPFNKFPTSSKTLGPQMRSVGEVLGIGGNFNEAFMKALRSLEIGLEIPSLAQLSTTPFEIDRKYIEDRLGSPYRLSLLTCLEALRIGISGKEIADRSKITYWFIAQIEEIYKLEQKITQEKSVLQNTEDLLYAKQLGFSDKYLAFLSDKSQRDILAKRFENKIFPVYKAVDTCSGEFHADTPYFYSTYTGDISEAPPLREKGSSVAILGSGPNRIGQGIEFDYACVKSCLQLKKQGKLTIMLNSNPETVSTDYDSSDRLYISPLYSEDLFDILVYENPEGIISSFSGQTGIKIREHIENSFRDEFASIKFLGPSLKTLACVEDRNQFAEVIKSSDLATTRSMEVRGHKKLITAITEIGMPVIIRPSYVIGGESMYVFNSRDELKELPTTLKELLNNNTSSFLVETYLEGALEYDVDLIRDKSGNILFAVCEHIEHAGVHSGDSGMVCPPSALTSRMYNKMKSISYKLAEELEVIGPINIQYAVKEGKIYCIEANARGSRTLPFLSKAYDIDLPAIATDAMLGKEIKSWDREYCEYFCVKQSTFPFDRFVQDNIILGPKMRSTGETMGLDYDKERAVLKSYLGNYPSINKEGKILLSMSDNSKNILLPYLKPLSRLGYTFCATEGTYRFIKKQGISCQMVAKISGNGSNISMHDILKSEELRMVFNTPQNTGRSKSDGEFIRNLAISHGIPTFTRAENIRAIMEALIENMGHELTPLSLQEVCHNN